MPRTLVLALLAVAAISASPVRALDEDKVGFERTPPRLGLVEGEVSFWRPGAADWAPALPNTALAPGDALYTGAGAHIELQIAGRAFARADEHTQLGLNTLEPDYVQLEVRSGQVSLDLRSVKAGQTIELDTPGAAFAVERSGYYRVEVAGATTTFTSRRGGRATLTPAAGEPVVVGASEQVVVTGTDAPRIESYAAPDLDAWDRWNYVRTDQLIDAVSARYVSADVYGVDDLDAYGDWRIIAPFGAVWVPVGVAPGWVPYSTGRWMFDPYYGWTWVDDAPWGWAPFHYGRWVYVSGLWGWCPGPIVVRTYYAPALVAFFGGGGVSIGVTIGTPVVGWVALGWGEPLVPWWGPPSFRQHAHWAGWAGPRFVNKVEVRVGTVYAARKIDVYVNAGVRNAVVEVARKEFGRYSRREVRYRRTQGGKLSPLHGELRVEPDRTSLVAAARPAPPPPRDVRERGVVAMREPRIEAVPRVEAGRAAKPRPGSPGTAAPAYQGGPPPRVVKPKGERPAVSRRAPFGQEGEAERRIPPPAPRFERSESGRATPPERPRAAEAPAPPREAPSPGRAQGATPPSARREQAPTAPRSLPGEPANRVYREWRRPPQGSMPQGQPAPRGPGDARGGGAEADRGGSRRH